METTDLEPNESVQNIYCSAAHEYEFVCVYETFHGGEFQGDSEQIVWTIKELNRNNCFCIDTIYILWFLKKWSVELV